MTLRAVAESPTGGSSAQDVGARRNIWPTCSGEVDLRMNSETARTRVLSVNSPVAVALSTLAAAALFAPLRRLVQKALDRRFNPPRYYTEAALSSFAARLKHAVDLDMVRHDLAATAHQALSPLTSRLDQPSGLALTRLLPYWPRFTRPLYELTHPSSFPSFSSPATAHRARRSPYCYQLRALYPQAPPTLSFTSLLFIQLSIQYSVTLIDSWEAWTVRVGRLPYAAGP